MKTIYISLLCGVILLNFSACKKILEIGTPQNQLTTDKVFADTISANAAMVNVYALYDKTIDPNFNKYLGLYTDEFLYPTRTSDEFVISNLTPTNPTVLNNWRNNYFAIYSSNQVIEQLKLADGIPEGTRKSLTAEARFLRAFSYFYLVNTYGSVPLLLTTDVKITSVAARSDSSTVYNQIVDDLENAQANLPLAYLNNDKARAIRLSATALLARVSLYQGKWLEAERLATEVINSGNYTLASDLSEVFAANSPESIFQFYTQYGFTMDSPILIPGTGAPLYPLTTSLINAFEANDQRKTAWTKSTNIRGTVFSYAYKYHNRNSINSLPEYLMALRLAEQYLIRSEARAHNGNLVGSITDLNVIRQRAGLSNLQLSLDHKAIYNAITQEWRLEFFAEWGTRFLELKHTGQLNSTMGAYKSTWSAKSLFFPIPQNEITYNSQLVQNPGY